MEAQYQILEDYYDSLVHWDLLYRSLDSKQQVIAGSQQIHYH